MQGLRGERLLAAWERGQTLREPWRALALLEAAGAGGSQAEWAQLPLAERNAQLMRVRVMTFGPQVEAFAECDACGEPLEFEVSAEALALPAAAAAQSEGRGARAVNSADLAAALESGASEDARAVLMERTLGVDVRGLDGPARAAYEAEFERWNAAAEMRCVLQCAACGARQISDFDIASFLWREVAQAARRMLAEVHRLARAYGWSEQAVLELSDARRNAYLDLLNQETVSA